MYSFYFAVMINLTVQSEIISSQPLVSTKLSTTVFSITSNDEIPTSHLDVSIASTMKTAATFSDIIHLVVLSIVNVFNIILVGLLIELIVILKGLISTYNNYS